MEIERPASQTQHLDSDYFQPAEWEPHRSVWLAWPSHHELWQDNLIPAQNEFIAFCEAICDFDPETKLPQGKSIDLLVPSPQAMKEAQLKLAHLPVVFHEVLFGDIWLRDSAPLFLKNHAGVSATVQFKFNGWGGKYDLPHDTDVSANVARAADYIAFCEDWILEGGSIEVDGQGTALTTKQCLLNPNRNPGLSKSDIEEKLKSSLGTQKVLWLDQGLLNDHTDGHIDTLARFCAPGQVLCMKAADEQDPNAATYKQIESDLRGMTDAKGRTLKIHTVSSPGAVRDEDGKIMPASYLNFYISNTCVIVPTYGSPQDQKAVEMIASCFPNRKTVGLSSIAILSGGGAFHCISQQEPK